MGHSRWDRDRKVIGLLQYYALHCWRSSVRSTLASTTIGNKPSAVCRFEAQGEQLLSFDLGDNLMAAGAAGTVVLWDRRTRRKVADFSDTHEQEVHQVMPRYHATISCHPGCNECMVYTGIVLH